MCSLSLVPKSHWGKKRSDWSLCRAWLTMSSLRNVTDLYVHSRAQFSILSLSVLCSDHKSNLEQKCFSWVCTETPNTILARRHKKQPEKLKFEPKAEKENETKKDALLRIGETQEIKPAAAVWRYKSVMDWLLFERVVGQWKQRVLNYKIQESWWYSSNFLLVLSMLHFDKIGTNNHSSEITSKHLLKSEPFLPLNSKHQHANLNPVLSVASVRVLYGL